MSPSLHDQRKGMDRQRFYCLPFNLVSTINFAIKVMKRTKNDASSQRAKIIAERRLMSNSDATTMQKVFEHNRNYLMVQSAKRIAEDADARAALAAIVIRSQDGYDDKHKEVVADIESACSEVGIKDADKNYLISLFNSFIEIPDEEQQFAQKISIKDSDVSTIKISNWRAKMNIKSLLEGFRQAIALGTSLSQVQPTFNSFVNILLNICSVIYDINNQITGHLDANTEQGRLLMAIIRKSLCGRRSVGIEELIEDQAVKGQIASERVDELLQEFEKKYRMIDYSDGKVSFVEEIGLT